MTRLKAGEATTAEEALRIWDEGQAGMSNAVACGSVFSEVHPDEAVRSRGDAAVQEVHKLDTELQLDRELYDVFAALDAATLDPQAARLLEKTLRDFRRSGVDRDDETRARIKEINEQLTTVGLQFRQNLRDDKRSIRVAPERLGGMPQDWLDAHPADDEGLVTITSDYPDAIPVRTFCTDRDVRAQMVDAFLNIGWPTNEALLQEMFELREELARLVGYDTWADYDADVKMIGKGSAIPEFIDRIADVALESGERDRAVLLARLQQDHPEADRDRRGRLPVLRRGGPQGAVRRRRPGRPHVLRLHGRPGRAARRDRPPVRPVVHAGDGRRAVAPRRDGVRRDARRRGARPDLPRPPPAREQVQPRRAVHPHRRAGRPAAARGHPGLQLPARR